MAQAIVAVSRDLGLSRDKAARQYRDKYGSEPPHGSVTISATPEGLYKTEISVPDPTAMEAVGKDDVGGAGLDEGEIDLGVAAEALAVDPKSAQAGPDLSGFFGYGPVGTPEPKVASRVSVVGDELRVEPGELDRAAQKAIAKEKGHFPAVVDKPYSDYRSGKILTTEPVGPFGREKTIRITPEDARNRISVQKPQIPFTREPDPLDVSLTDTSTMPLDSQGMELGAEAGGMQTQAEAGGPSFLSRLGGAIKDNPMIAAQIAQVVGGIGSGVLGGRRMAKEQAKGARRQREAMNMANAISTLTRGRTQPAVAPRPVISKPGGAETIFDILGTLGQGGAQITQGIQQREEAAEDRRRQQETEEFRKDYLTRGQDIEELKVEGEMRAQQQAAQIERLKSIKPVASKDFNPLGPGEGDQLRTTLNELKALHAEGGPATTGYFHQYIGDRHWRGPAKLQQTFKTKRNMLIAIVKDVMGLGRLTDRDLDLVLKTLPELGDTERQVEGKIDGILGTLDRLEQRSTGVLGLGAGAPAGTGGDYSGMSNEELADLYAEDPNNDAVADVMIERQRGIE